MVRDIVRDFSLASLILELPILASSVNSDVVVMFGLGRYFGLKENQMSSVVLFVRLEAKPGKEEEVVWQWTQRHSPAQVTRLIWK